MVACVVVIAGEVGGRWSEETKVYLWSLACENSHSENEGLARSASLCRTKAVAMSLGVGDEPPSAHEVVSAIFREV